MMTVRLDDKDPRFRNSKLLSGIETNKAQIQINEISNFDSNGSNRDTKRVEQIV